jgi:hypothetical protein
MAMLARRVGIGLFLAMLFVGTLEVCTRVEAWWRWDAAFWGPYSGEMLQVTDERGTHNRPGARFEKWTINSAGFRGPELSVAKPDGLVRVGLAGASEVFGLYESPDKELAAQLQAQLNLAAPGRFEVVNLAAAGMSPPRIRELFERWAGRFAFDVVVLYPTPAFYLDVEPPKHDLAPRAAVVASRTTFKPRLPDKVWTSLRQALPAALQSRLKQAEIDRVRRAHPPDWVWSKAPPERVALLGSDLRELVETIERSGARVVLASHANRFGAPLSAEDESQMTGWIRFYPRATSACLIDMERQASQVVRQIGRERGLEVVDVQAALGKDPRYYADFSHFTDEGAARVAAALADPLQALGRDLRRAANQ